MATESLPYKLYNYDELILYNLGKIIWEHEPQIIQFLQLGNEVSTHYGDLIKYLAN
jgi:hypothetical protein